MEAVVFIDGICKDLEDLQRKLLCIEAKKTEQYDARDRFMRAVAGLQKKELHDMRKAFEA